MNVQRIEQDGEAVFAVLPYAEFQSLMEELEELRDAAAFGAARARREEGFPGAVAQRLLNGESPVKVFREHRGLTQAALAQQCGVAPATISQLESGKRSLSVETLKALARALQVDADMLLGGSGNE
ncbi:MAG: helix-turn-helix transcriptional regulator [Magnetococcales bacterium]|nr:helix-turn-helix transcriptional regulator [Magnetococcales bacterium]